jgi:hypothetical protein
MADNEMIVAARRVLLAGVTKGHTIPEWMWQMAGQAPVDAKARVHLAQNEEDASKYVNLEGRVVVTYLNYRNVLYGLVFDQFSVSAAACEDPRYEKAKEELRQMMHEPFWRP